MVVSDIPLQVFGKTPQISPITHSLPLLTVLLDQTFI